MAIEVYCDCGNALTVGADLSGKKVRCKACGVVLQIPEVPKEEAGEGDGPASSDYEVVSPSAAAPIVCPSCGASAAPGDTACLACGAELGSAPGLLARIPRPILFAVVALLGFGLLGYVGYTLWERSRPAAKVREGISLYTQGDYKAAQAAYEAALGYDRENAEAIIGLAEVGVALHDTRLVERYVTRAVELCTDPRQRARLRIAHARVLLDAGNAMRARNEAIDASGEDPDIAGVDDVVGLAALQSDPPQEAEALARLRAAARARSEDYRVYRELARLLSRQGDHGEARTAGERAVQLRNEDVELWLTLAGLREADRDLPGRKAALLEAIRRDENNSAAYSRLSRVWLDEQNLDEALRCAQRARDLAPDNVEAQVAVGRIVLAQGRNDVAKDELERALRLGQSWEAEFLLGQAMIALNEVQNGLRKIQAALERQPDNLALHLDAGRIAIEARGGNVAATILQRAIQLDERSYDARILMARALAAQENGRSRNDRHILNHLRFAIDQIDGRRREAPLLLGTHYLERNDPDANEAINVLTAGLTANPRDPDLLFQKGVACIRVQRWDDAIAALEALEQVNAQYPDLQNRLTRAREGKFYNR